MAIKWTVKDVDARIQKALNPSQNGRANLMEQMKGIAKKMGLGQKPTEQLER